MSLRKKGFTLIELMIATVILLVGILALLSGFLSSAFLNTASSNLTIATNDAQYVLEQVRSLDYSTCIQTNFGGSCTYSLPALSNLPGETVNFKPYPDTEIGASISRITVEITWQDNGQTRRFELGTYIPR